MKRLLETLMASEWQNWGWKSITPCCISVALLSGKLSPALVIGPPYSALLDTRDGLHQMGVRLTQGQKRAWAQ